MSCDILELEILDEYEQDVLMNLDFSGDILYLLDQSISKDTLTIKHIHLNNGENKDSVLENYINCMGTISGNGEYLQWYESYDAGEFSSATGLTLKAVQYITYFDGNLQGHRFRRLCVWNWVDDWVWSEWTLQDNSYITNLGMIYDITHLESLVKNDNTPYFFSTGAGLFSQIGKGPFVGARSNNIINCTDITNGKIWEIDTTWENQPKQINSIQIDQTYTPESENAQSGKAVAEATRFKLNYLPVIRGTADDMDNFARDNSQQDEILFMDCSDEADFIIFTQKSENGDLRQYKFLFGRQNASRDGGIYWRECNAKTNTWTEWTSFVDSELNDKSENPVQNKAVAKAIGDIDTALDELHTYAQGLIGGATE